MSATKRGRVRAESSPQVANAGDATFPSVAIALAVVLCLVHADAFRLGFFADDFHFLDAARRASLPDLFLGRVGLYPWYRPLSRELFFLGLAPIGPATAAFLAHAACLVALAFATHALYRLAARFAPGRGACVAALLFAGSGVAKFLVGWASGFQDLLAVALALHAVLALERRREGHALLLAFLATFAKETGALAFAWVALHRALIDSRRREIASWVPLVLTAGGAAAIHVLVRQTWEPVQAHALSHRAAPELVAAARDAAAWFLPTAPGPWGPAVFGALVVGLAGAWAMRAAGTARAEVPRDADARRSTMWFLGGATILGLVPLLAAALSPLGRPHAYYACAALPWAALAFARLTERLPLRSALVTAWLAVNAWTLAYRAPDLDRDASWDFRRWDWFEAVRLSAVAERLSADVRTALAERPAGVVVLYHSLPWGCMFQSEDGPATRAALEDSSARAYYINEAPPQVASERFAILSFDLERHHLVRQGPAMENIQQAIVALRDGRGAPARAWIALVPSEARLRFDVAYTRAGTELVTNGPGAFVRSLTRDGLDSTRADLATRVTAAVPSEAHGVRDAWLAVLRRPRTASLHAAFADTLEARGLRLSATLERRFAAALESFPDSAARYDTARAAPSIK